MCTIYCPQVFALNDEDGHAYVLAERVPADLQEAVGKARQSCPEQAIEIFTSEG